MDAPTSRAIGRINPLSPVDNASRGKIRPGQVFHERRHVDSRILDQCQAGADHFSQIVRWNVGRHADGNARGTIDQQVRQSGRHYRRLALGAVVILGKINGFPIDVGEKFMRKPRHPDFRVSHCRRRIAIDGAEITLAIHEQVTHGEGLRHSNDGVVDGGIAVRVVFTNHVTHDPSRLLVGLVVVVAEFSHCVQHAAVNGLEAVSDIG